MRRITLLTDFGTADGYVAAMKGELVRRQPGVLLDDVAHDLEQGDVRGGSRSLGRYWNRWPEGTVHLVVVDPGVGTARRGMAVQADHRFLVGPDNGVFSSVIREANAWRAVELESGRILKEPESATFHGRDLFAPAAAFLARGGHLSMLGSPMSDPVILDEPDPVIGAESAQGEVLGADRFGNLQTNLPGKLLDQARKVSIGGVTVPVGQTYSDVARGDPLALSNSDGMLEVAARDASAAAVLQVAAGAPIRVIMGADSGPTPNSISSRASAGLQPKDGPGTSSSGSA